MEIGQYGYSVFSSTQMFRVIGGKIVPVQAADEIAFDSFIG